MMQPKRIIYLVVPKIFQKFWSNIWSWTWRSCPKFFKNLDRELLWHFFNNYLNFKFLKQQCNRPNRTVIELGVIKSETCCILSLQKKRPQLGFSISGNLTLADRNLLETGWVADRVKYRTEEKKKTQFCIVLPVPDWTKGIIADPRLKTAPGNILGIF